MRRSIPLLVTSILITSPLAAQQPCTSDEREVVAAIYQQLLERDPDRESRIFMYDIGSGRGTVRRNVAEIALSREHQQRFLWPTVADAVFRATRNARPDEGQLISAVQALSMGTAQVPDVVAAFAATEAMTAPPPVRVMVLYKRLLSRDPDAAAPRQEQIMERGMIGRLSHGIVRSEEYRSTVGLHGVPRYDSMDVYGDAVRVLYRHLLGREADAGGLKGAVDYAVLNGLTALIPYFLNSPEYIERFGEHRVPGPGGGRTAFCAQR